MAGNLVQASATGDVATGPRVVHAIVFTPGTAASTVEVRDGASGAVRLTLKGAANGPSIPFSSSIHLTITGAAALASVVYS
jgi:hypothetical protein